MKSPFNTSFFSRFSYRIYINNLVFFMCFIAVSLVFKKGRLLTEKSDQLETNPKTVPKTLFWPDVSKPRSELFARNTR